MMKEKPMIHDPDRIGDFRYCPYCAAELALNAAEDVPRLGCPSCGFIHYRNPTPAAGGMVLKDGKILLVKRKFEPKVGEWSLPAGFMEYGESPTECVIRELKEETGLTGVVKDLVGVYPSADDPRTRVVLILYHIEVTGGTEKPGDDAAELGYFAEENYPKLAWSSHHRALRDFFARRARIKVEDA